MKSFEYDNKDVPKFQKEVCPNCILKGRCIEEGHDEHWFLVCPKYHSWKLGYTSFVSEQLQYEREHFEEINEKTKKNSNKTNK